LVLFFLNNLGFEKGTANVVVLVWSGTCYVTPLLGGWIADSFWGRFKTILVFVTIYMLGLIGMTVGSIDGIDREYPWVALISLFIIAVGTGGIKPNVVSFGADQFVDFEGSATEKNVWKQTFFNWFYFSINLGSAISYTGIAYLQQNVSFTLGLAVPTGVMALSIVFFLLGYKWYHLAPPTGSIVGRGVGMWYEAMKAPSHVKEDSIDFWDRAKKLKGTNGEDMYEEKEVDNMRALVKMFPIFGTFILFWTAYAQMSSVFFTQGTVLDLKLGSFTIPVASLHIFNALGILVLVSIFDRVLYPFLASKNIQFGMLRRIGTGFFLSSIGMVYAGLLEVWRLKLFNSGEWFVQYIGTLKVIAVKLNVLVQAPAYFFIAAGEVMSSVTGLEFAYSQAPSNMRSMVLSIFYLTSAAGNYLGSIIVLVVNAATAPNQWIGNDLNHSHLDLYFLLLAALGFINFFVYLAVSSSYTLQQPEEAEDEKEKQSEGGWEDYSDDLS